MKKIVLLIVVLFLCSCGDSAPDLKPQYKVGDIVCIKIDNRKGLVMTASCSSKECWYKLKYVRTHENTEKYDTDLFYDYELKECEK
jgi:hypothetical protein